MQSGTVSPFCRTDPALYRGFAAVRPGRDMPDITLMDQTLPAQAMGTQARSRSVEDDVKTAADAMDRGFRANMARATLGLSLSTLGGAYLDWTTHLLAAPGKQAWLGWKAWRKALRYGNYLAHCATHKGQAPPCIAPLPGDHRFDDA